MFMRKICPTQSLPSRKKQLDVLHHKASNYIDQARRTVLRTIDVEMVRAYWAIGRDIVEQEQKGKKKAEYGSSLLIDLSRRLIRKYGRGFGVSTLRDMRQFYQTFPDISIHHAVRGGSGKPLSSKLGWIHYRALMRVSNLKARQ